MPLYVQVIFRKSLSPMQWCSLVLLTVGCMIKQLDFGGTVSTTANNSFLIFVIIQAICSSLAGVYNEYLLKNQGAHVNIYVQNVFMYLDSIACNVLVLAVTGDLGQAFSGSSWQSIWRLDVMLIIVNNAAIGIVTSFFLKYMNSILKTFASALELVFTALLCRLLFAIPIHANTVLSIAVVSAAIYLYSQNPVQSSHVAMDKKLELGEKESEDV